MKVSVVDVAGNMQEECVQAVLTVHTCILTCVWDNEFYRESYCVYHLYTLMVILFMVPVIPMYLWCSPILLVQGEYNACIEATAHTSFICKSAQRGYG